MCADTFNPALAKVLGSPARTELLAVLVERWDDWLTAAELCEQANISQSGFHRDHKTVLVEFGLVERRDVERPGRHPKYSLADSEQAECLSKLHYALQARVTEEGSLAREPMVKFTE